MYELKEIWHVDDFKDYAVLSLKKLFKKILRHSKKGEIF